MPSVAVVPNCSMFLPLLLEVDLSWSVVFWLLFGVFYLLPHSQIFQFPHVYRMCSSSWFLYQGLSIGTEMLACVSDDDTRDV